MFIFIAILIAFVVIFLFFKTKTPKVSAQCLVTGAVKSGKSLFALHLAMSELRKRRIKVAVYNFFARIFRKPLKPRPLLYSTVPLKTDYVPVTKELILREERFVYGSVIYAPECSLIANSMDYNDSSLNERFTLFCKLIGHSTKGGLVVWDTQSIADNHYALKRCISEYFYIHHSVTWLPFFVLSYVRELRYSEDGSEINTYQSDLEDTLKCVWIPKKLFKIYDRYCYSIFTDGKPVQNQVVHGKNLPDLKARKIISFHKYKSLDKFIEGDKK